MLYAMDEWGTRVLCYCRGSEREGFQNLAQPLFKAACVDIAVLVLLINRVGQEQRIYDA